MIDASVLPVRIANRALAGEDSLRHKLAAHAGAVVRVVTGPAQATFAIDADGKLSPVFDATAPSLTLTVAPHDVPALLHDPSRFDTLVAVDGDAGLAATLRSLSATIPWFVERLLGNTFGAVIGQRIADTGRSMLGFPAEAAARLGGSMRTYVGEESMIAVAQAQAATFAAEVDAIASRVDALAARIDALQANRSR